MRTINDYATHVYYLRLVPSMRVRDRVAEHVQEDGLQEAVAEILGVPAGAAQAVGFVE